MSDPDPDRGQCRIGGTRRWLGVSAALAGALLVIAGCAGPAGTGDEAQTRPPSEPAPQAPAVVAKVYDCADGERVVTRGEGRERMALHRAGSTHHLERRASGGYDNADWTWQRDGEGARLTSARGEDVRCGRTPGASAWAEAGLRGVRYRAEGNNREWLLEAGPDQVVFRGATNDEPVISDAVSWGQDATLNTTDDTGIRVERLQGDCPGRAQGPDLEPVHVYVDEQRYNGCGRFLEAENE